MKAHIKMFLLTALVAGLASPALAARGDNSEGNRGNNGSSSMCNVPEVYQVTIPSKMICPDERTNNFADFSKGCSYTAAYNENRTRTVSRPCSSGGSGNRGSEGGTNTSSGGNQGRW